MPSRRHLIIETVLLFAVLYLPGYLMPASLPDFSAPLFHVRYAILAVPQILLILFLIAADGEAGDTAGASGSGTDRTLRRNRTLRRFGISRFRAACIVPAFLAAATLIVLVTALQYSLVHLASLAVLRPRKAYVGPGPAMLPLALLTCLETGYREELFFRSYLLTRCQDLGVPAGAAVAASTLLFAAGHLYEGVAGAALVAVIGLCLAFLFLRTRDLHVTALAHGLYNFGVLVLSLT